MDIKGHDTVKSKRKRLIDRLDAEIKKYVKRRDKGICQKCRRTVTGSNAHASHVIPRSKGNALRWDPQNLKLLCFHDHINWWHKNPVESGAWFKKEFPKRWAYLKAKKDNMVKFSISDLEDKLKELRDNAKEDK